MGLEMGKRSLQYHQKGLNVVAENLSNADNKYYSRQRVESGALPPLERADLSRSNRSGQIGQGVEIVAIRRQRDAFLDDRIRNSTSDLGYWDTKSNYLSRVENIQRALEDDNLNVRMDQFWQAWDDLSKYPDQSSFRNVLVNKTNLVTSEIRQQFESLHQLHGEINGKLKQEVNFINHTLLSIGALNKQIQQAENLGNNANTLRDQRDKLVEILSNKLEITINESQDKDEFVLYTSGIALVQGNKVSKFEIKDINSSLGNQSILLLNHQNFESGRFEEFVPKKGTLGAYFEVRDNVISKQIKKLDEFAAQLIFSVNDIHQRGFDLNQKPAGLFFTQRYYGSSSIGNEDENQDGYIDHSFIAQIKSNPLALNIEFDKPYKSEGEIIISNPNNSETIKISYEKTDSIVNIIDKFNGSQDFQKMSINLNRQLIIQSTVENNFNITYLQDNGDFLVKANLLKQSGENGAIDFNQPNSYEKLVNQNNVIPRLLKNPASWIDIHHSIKQSENNIASSGALDFDGDYINEEPFFSGNFDIAKEIYELRNQKLTFNKNDNFNNFYQNVVSKIASLSQNSEMEKSKVEILQKHYNNLKQSISGVNIDEEMTNMITLQRGYQAAARIVNVMDNLIDTIINRMGV